MGENDSEKEIQPGRKFNFESNGGRVEARSIARSRIRNERARGRKYLTGFYRV